MNLPKLCFGRTAIIVLGAASCCILAVRSSAYAMGQASEQLRKSESARRMVANLRRDLQNPALRRLAVERYRMVQRIEVKLKTLLYLVHGFGEEAIFPAGNASVVYWLVYTSDGSGSHTIDSSSIQQFRMSEGKLVSSRRARIKLYDHSVRGQARNLVDFLKGRNFEFASSEDRRLFQRMSTDRMFVDYRNDPIDGFLDVDTGAAGDRYVTGIDLFTNRRITDREFLQKYGLPTANVDLEAPAAAPRHHRTAPGKQ